ncbi:MAG: tetratricopeptide repeat protein [Planctomycetes bacterium]|nr:tetratricopeptide repeat protein [Planctomycetota bacterium]
MPAPSAKDVFLDALERAPDERRAYVDAACGDDAELRRRVLALLGAHVEAEARLGDDDPSRSRVGPAAALPGAALGRADLGVGDRVGPYELEAVLGQGGFGTVYRARQDEPVRRRVALKLVKLGMDTRAVIARFESERQALALMDHPHIAKVLDAGASDTGRPYFVMELVDGKPITAYCERRALPPRERLQLFVTVCHAIQHAHQKGVIHRDIKPGNVLVGDVDGRPVPKVIDFGIAKATEADLGHELLTAEGHVVGTPSAMSPEQLSGTGDVDTRSDVYALGVLVYELLCGRPPFDPAPFAEMQHVVLHDDPPRPSVRARRAGVDVEIAEDLDWIVLRCLEKDRAHRYPTAFALALDVERFLDERPVEAAPPSTFYRIRKLARRHRVATTAAAVVLLTLLLGIAGTTSGWIEANRANRSLDVALADARREAERAREAETRAADEAAEAKRQEALARDAEHLAEDRAEEARVQAEVARAVVEFLDEDLLGAAVPSSQPGQGRDVTVREVLDVASERIDQASSPGGRFATLPAVEAAVRLTIGSSYRELGLYDRAEAHLRRALEVLTEVQGALGTETLRCSHLLADVLRLTSRLDEAYELGKATWAASREHLGPDAAQTLSLQRMLALVEIDRGDVPRADELLRDAADRARAAYGPNHEQTLDAMASLAVVELNLGRVDEARRLFEETVTRRAETLGPEHPDTLVSLLNLANFDRGHGRLDEAERIYSTVVDAVRRVSGPEHPDMVFALGGLGHVAVAQGRAAEAEARFLEAYELAGRVFGPAKPEALELLGARAWLFVSQRRLDEADALTEEAVRRALEGLGPRHPCTLARMKERTAVLYELGRLEEARDLVARSLATEREVLGDRHPTTIKSIANMGVLLEALGDHEGAERQLREALALDREVSGPDSADTLEAQQNLAGLLVDWKRPAEALELAQDAVERARRVRPEDGLENGTHLMRLGGALTALGRYDDAEIVLLEAAARLEPFGPRHFRSQDVSALLARLYEAMGRPDDAARWAARVVDPDAGG